MTQIFFVEKQTILLSLSSSLSLETKLDQKNFFFLWGIPGERGKIKLSFVKDHPTLEMPVKIYFSYSKTFFTN